MFKIKTFFKYNKINKTVDIQKPNFSTIQYFD